MGQKPKFVEWHLSGDARQAAKETCQTLTGFFAAGAAALALLALFSAVPAILFFAIVFLFCIVTIQIGTHLLCWFGVALANELYPSLIPGATPPLRLKRPDSLPHLAVFFSPIPAVPRSNLYC